MRSWQFPAPPAEGVVRTRYGSEWKFDKNTGWWKNGESRFTWPSLVEMLGRYLLPEQPPLGTVVHDNRGYWWERVSEGWQSQFGAAITWFEVLRYYGPLDEAEPHGLEPSPGEYWCG